MVRILFFAQAAAWAGRREDARALASPMPLGEFRKSEAFAGLDGRLEGVRFAVNRAFAQDGALVADGDEVAVLPPVSGG